MRIYGSRRECQIIIHCLRACIGQCATASEMSKYAEIIERIEGCMQKQKSQYRDKSRCADEDK